MSARLFKGEVVFVQRLLKSMSLYRGRLDGIWGRLTDAAAKKFESETQRLAKQIGTFDLRTETQIATLHLAAQEAARNFLCSVRASGLDARIVSGTRTYDEQNALFRRGRYGNPGPRVTNARGGASTHNFAIAWDIGLFEKGRYLRSGAGYEAAAIAGMDEGLDWGGDWRGFRDRPHYEIKTGLELREIRALFERGKAYL